MQARVYTCRQGIKNLIVSINGACRDGLSSVTKQVKKYRNRLKIRDSESSSTFGSLLESFFRVLTIAS